MMIPECASISRVRKKKNRQTNKQISERKGINRASERATKHTGKREIDSVENGGADPLPPSDLNRRRRIADKIQPISSLIRSPWSRERETRKTVHNLSEKREKENAFHALSFALSCVKGTKGSWKIKKRKEKGRNGRRN